MGLIPERLISANQSKKLKLYFPSHSLILCSCNVALRVKA